MKTADGHQRVVRHGHLPEREVMTGFLSSSRLMTLTAFGLTLRRGLN
jgi:hypothetical protein